MYCFNFYDAAGVFFLRDVMKEYCSFADRNRLIDTVADKLNVDACVAGCRALGIVGKMITGPLWRFLVSAAPFSAVFDVYQQLTDHLGAWAVDPEDLFDGSGRAFADADIHTTTDVFTSLFSQHASDDDTKQLLQLLCSTFHAYMVRAWAPYLEGGEHQPCEATTHALPKTNVLSEHDFAQLDRFLREKPNVQQLWLWRA